MNLRIAALIYLPALLLVPLCAQAQLPIGKLVSKNQVLEVPLNNIDNEILVNAKVRGEEFQFLLDTGAPFFISSAIQKKYDFPVLFKANLSDASGKKDETVVVSVDSIRVGPFLFTDVWAVVINMENETHQCHEFVGNFGSNLLSFLTVQFNLQKAKAILTDNKELLAHKPSVPFSPAKISTQCDFFFPITIAGNIIDTIQFDSGDGSLYEISEKALNQLIRFKPNAIVKKGIGITSLGSLGMPEPAKQYVIRTSITFNGTTIQRALAYNTYADKSRLGRSLLQYGVLTLDYINHRYAFEQFEKPLLQNLNDFGFTPVIYERQVIAGTVWEGSEAEKKGLSSGSTIIQINDVKFEDMGDCEIEKVMRALKNRETIQATFINKIKSTQK